MDRKTVHQLNQVNADFYDRVGERYDASRRYDRKGWHVVLRHIEARAGGANPYRVLDIGCGNAQFGKFLFENLRAPLFYHGVDSSEFLLSQARQRIPAARAAFARLDLVTGFAAFERIAAGDHLVVLNNVLHHLPSFEFRRRLLAACAAKLPPGGLLVFTLWQFLAKERWRERVVPWTAQPHIDPAQLEPNDYLLDWRKGEPAIRYCHFIDARELDALVQALDGLSIVDDFFSDGKTDDLNRYVILQSG